MTEDARAKAVKRVENSFRDIYLTLISIIQGVALGFLVQAVGTDYRHIGADRAGRTAAIFILIVIIWQEYVIGSTMYAWIPRTIDALVPFLLGAGQGLMIAALDGTITEFLFFYTCTIGIGVVAAINYARNATAGELESTRDAQLVIAVHPRLLVWLDSIGLVLSATLLIYALSSLPQPSSAVLSWLSAALVFGLLASHYWRWVRPMREALH
ncbi:hypothetical protein ACTMTJ_38165 [Phytohabitans sp. LJ34]|uniref:hypothetical protein n=1 Tax=Phytohabitans sp. LJ34 TaxID=3452217 RepID=UPI003F889D22